MSAGEFVGGLLHSVTVAHVFHLQQKGPGSYARHVALEALYGGIQDAADELAECYQGCYGLIDDYPSTFDLPSGEVGAWLDSLSEFVQRGREGMPQDSEIQNLIDEVQGLIDRAIYKVRNLE